MQNFSLKKIESFSTLKSFARRVLSDAWKLFQKNFYKMTEFQLLFKMLYFSIIFWGLSYIIKILIDILSRAIDNFALFQAVRKIDIISTFQFKPILILTIWIIVILYIYFIERTGITYMSECYYKNKPVSFFHTLRQALRRTPKVIIQKLIRRRIVFFIVLFLYISKSLLSAFDAPENLINFFSTTLTISLIFLILSLIFFNGFTVHVACLNRNESATKFKKQLPWAFNQRRIFTLTVFYAIIFSIVTVIVLGYWILIKYIVLNSQDTSFLLSLIVAFTFFLILVLWSLFKSFRIDLTTILYMLGRQELQLSTPTIEPLSKAGHRHTSKPLTGILILSSFTIIMSFITMTPVESGITNIYEFAESVATYNDTLDLREQERISFLDSLLINTTQWIKDLF